MPTNEQIKEALKVVTDPEIGINIVDLGLIYEIEQTEEGEVHVRYSLTSMGCPAGDVIDSEIIESVSTMEGVSAVTTEVTFTPAWGPDKMSDFAKSALGFF